MTMNPSWSETWGEELSKIQDLQKRLKQNDFNKDGHLAENSDEDSGAVIVTDGSVTPTFPTISIEELDIMPGDYQRKHQQQLQNSLQPLTLNQNENNAINSYTQQFVSLSEKNVNLKNYVNQLHHQIEYKKRRNNNNDQLYEDLDEKIRCLSEEKATYMQTLRKTEDKLQLAESELAKKDADIAALRREVADTKAFSQKLENSKVTSEFQKDLLEQRLVDLKNKMKKAENSVINQTNKLVKSYREKADDDNEKLSKANNKILTEKKELEEKLEKANNTIQEMKTHMKHKEDRTVKALEDAQKRISELLKELEQNRSAIKTLNKQLEKKTKDFEESNKEVEKLQHLSETQSIHEDNIEKSNQSLSHELQSLKLELKNSEKKIENYQQKIKDLIHEKLESVSTRSTHISEPEVSEADSERFKRSSSFAKKISELNVSLAAKDAQIQRLQIELNDTSEEIERNQKLQMEISVVKRKLKTAEIRIAEIENLTCSLQVSNTRLTEKNFEFNEQLNETKRESESLESRLNERTCHLVQCKEELQNSKFKSKDLQERLEEKSQIVSKLEEENNKFKSTFEDQKKSIRDLESRLKAKDEDLKDQKDLMLDFTSGHKTKFQQIVNSYKKKCDEYLRQIQELKNESENDKNSMFVSHKQIEKLKKEVESNLVEIKGLRDELNETKLAEDNKNRCQDIVLKNLEEMASNDGKKVKILEAELRGCKKELSKYILEINRMQETFEKNLQLKNEEIFKLESELKMTSSSLVEEADQVARLENALQERQELIQGLNQKIASAEDQKSNLEMEVSTEREKRGLDSEQIRMLMNDVREKSDRYDRDMISKDAEISSLKRQLRKLEEEMDEKIKDQEMRDKELNDVKMQEEEEKMKISGIEFEKIEMKRKLDFKIEEVSKLEDQLKDTKRKMRSFESQKNEDECFNIQLESQIKNLKREIEKLKEMLTESKEQVEMKEEDLKMLKSDVESLQNQLKLKKKEVYEKSSQLEEQQYQLSLRNQQVQQLTVEIDLYKNQTDDVVSVLRHQLAKSQQEVSNRNRQIVRLDEELLKIKEDADKMRKELEKRYENIDLLKSDYKERGAQIDAAKKMVDKLKSDQLEVVADRNKLSKMLAISRERETNSQHRVTQCQKELETLYNELDELKIASEEVGSCAEEKEEQIICLRAKVKSLEKQRVVLETKFNEEYLKMQRDSQTQNLLHQQEIEKLMKRNSQLICRAAGGGGGKEINENEELRSALNAKSLESSKLNKLIHLKNAEISRLQLELSDDSSQNVSRRRRRTPQKAPQSNLKTLNQSAADISDDTFEDLLVSDRYNSIQIRKSTSPGSKRSLFTTSSPIKDSLLSEGDTETSLYERIFTSKYDKEDSFQSSSSLERFNDLQQKAVSSETRRTLTGNRIEKLKVSN